METLQTNPPAPSVTKVFFFKEIFTNAYIANGERVNFEQLEGNQGVLALESPRDDALIACLNDAAHKQIGGIVRISEEEYHKKKAEFPSVVSARRLAPGQEMLRVLGRKPPQLSPREPAAAAVDNPTAQRNPPTPFSQPPRPPAAPVPGAPGNTPTSQVPNPPAPPAEPLSPEQIAAQTEGETPRKFNPATRRLSQKPQEEAKA